MLVLLIVSLVIATIFLLLVQQAWITTVDDAFITLRYSRHFASGYGPTWNAGEPPIEGYTTFLWMLILAMPHVLHLDAIVFAKVVGVACTLVIFTLTFWAVFSCSAHATVPERVLAAFSAVAFLVVFAPTTIHAVTGMETALFTCLVTAYFVSLAVALNRPCANCMRLVALLGLLVGITRPEGNVAVGAAALVAFLLLPAGSRRQFLSSWFFLYVVPGLLYMLWRVWYYQALLPLPFLVKVVHQGPFAGLGPVVDFVVYMGLHVGILCALGVFYLGRTWLPAVAGSIAFGCFWLVPAHIMGYNWRFLYPIIPLIMIVAAYVVIGVMRMAAHAFHQKNVIFSYLPVFVATAIPVLTMARDVPFLLSMPVIEGRGLQAAHIRLGEELAAFKALNQQSNPLLAIGDAGAAPYYSTWRTLDHFGLNEPTIARTGNHDPAYVLNQEPDVVVLISQSPDTFSSPLLYENDLYAAVVARGMLRAQVLTYLPNRHYLWVFVHPNDPIATYFAGLPQSSDTR